MLNTLSRRLFDPITIAPLVGFRVAFGALMLWEVWRYFHYNRIARYYVEPSFFFHYYGFDWLRPLPGDGMFLVFHGLGLLSVLIMLGLCYRLSMTLFWLSFSYVFLLDQAQYLNHFYLISLVSFLLIFVPAHRALAVDALLRPSIRSAVAPNWALWLLRGQMAIVYVFGGLAKINPDWLAGEPLRAWLAARTDFPVIGGLFTEEWMVYLFSYGGLLLDLFVVPLLLWRRTRLPALALALAFHLTNSRLFNIGIFPWLAIAATLLFLPPDWFRLGRWQPAGLGAAGVAVSAGRRRWILAGMALYFAVQIGLPLRHWLYPGDPSWTEEGHTLAWHMRLREKKGTIALFASDPATGATWRVPAEDYLTARQFDQMKDNPHMILRFAHHLAKHLAADGQPRVQIRAWAMISLNSRAPQLLLDPTADLVSQPDDLLAADWILPLVQRPVPHGPQPALLISRRYPGVMLLINIAESVYPLERLSIQGGANGEHRLTAESFGVSALVPGACVLAHTETTDLRAVFTPCDETGSRPVIPPKLLVGALRVEAGAASQKCAGAVCVVADDGAA